MATRRSKKQAMTTSTTPTALRRAYQRYFHEFLPQLLNQLLIEDLHDLSCCFSYRLSDSEDPPWRLVLTEGRLTAVGHEGAEPQCTFVCDTQTLMAVVSGALHPQEAFFAQRIEMEGDLELALRLAFLLAPFFERYPFTP
jgi:predicted lipid carrier protein YhbT